MVRKTILLLQLAVSLGAFSLVARRGEHLGIPDKPAWAWDDSDRITARMDDAAARVRVRRDRTRKSATGPATESVSTEPVDVIDGKYDPHLFLPFELFDQLMTMGFADDVRTRAVYRAIKDPYRQRLGLPEDMWERLESIAAPYRSDRKRERENAFSSLPATERLAEGKEIAMLLCRDRYAALQEADRQFGPSFKRFLYEAVASSMSSVVIRKDNDYEATLASVNGGCP